MTGNNGVKETTSFILVLLISIVCCCSCKPVINSFKVTTGDTTQVRRITADDTLRVNWDVKGTPTLLVHERASGDTAVKMLELTLVVEKGGKEVTRPVQVEIVPKNSVTSITMSTKLSGDTLVAAGVKNPEVWGDRFEVLSVSNASGRPLIVLHANRTATLDKDGTPTNVFAGTPVEGRWEMRSVLTQAERTDHSILPERLKIDATLIYKKR